MYYAPSISTHFYFPSRHPLFTKCHFLQPCHQKFDENKHNLTSGIILKKNCSKKPNKVLLHGQTVFALKKIWRIILPDKLLQGAWPKLPLANPQLPGSKSNNLQHIANSFLTQWPQWQICFLEKKLLLIILIS